MLCSQPNQKPDPKIVALAQCKDSNGQLVAFCNNFQDYSAVKLSQLNELQVAIGDAVVPAGSLLFSTSNGYDVSTLNIYFVSSDPLPAGMGVPPALAATFTFKRPTRFSAVMSPFGFASLKNGSIVAATVFSFSTAIKCPYPSTITFQSWMHIARIDTRNGPTLYAGAFPDLSIATDDELC